MKSSRTTVRTRSSALPVLQFEEHKLTSFSGLVVFQQLFATLELKARLRRCFRHRKDSPIFSRSSTVLLLIVHLLLGYRELRHMHFYDDDPLVLRLLGLTQLPNVSTVSRQLSSMDERDVANLQTMMSTLVLDRLERSGIETLTLDFDGSVLGTGRRAEGTAIGFNRRKKGQRSYYPLFCTVAQTGQVLSVLHRSGNVHDSNGAKAFILSCIGSVRERLPALKIELRMDSAFFSDEILQALDKIKVSYSISVPFERFVELKEKIERQVSWRNIDEDCDSFEIRWKPKKWDRPRRFVFVRQIAPVQNKQALQLDLFVPCDYDFNYKVILTNKRDSAARLMRYHNGRGAQENIFAELKSENSLGYIPTRTWCGNQVYLLSVLLAHNLTRELQMAMKAPTERDVAKRPTLWVFERLDTVRRQIIQRAGRLIKPGGRLTLSMSANSAVRSMMTGYLDALNAPN